MAKTWHVCAALLILPHVTSAQSSEADYAETSRVSASAPSVSIYQPITREERLKWFVVATVGPQSLTAGVFSAGLGTARNKPAEYHPTWEGFGKRYGMRLTGVVTSNAMEASVGALWGEDPRYYAVDGQPISNRLKHILAMTVLARHDDGHLAPAYARYIGQSGSSFLSSTWRPESQSQVGDAFIRIALGFASHAASNAFKEFLPDLRRRVFRKSER